MADPEHLKRLRQGVDAWNTWRAKEPSLGPGTYDPDLFRMQVTQAELAMMQERLEELRLERERERSDRDAIIADLREDRDRWRVQAEKLLLTDQRQPVKRRW